MKYAAALLLVYFLLAPAAFADTLEDGVAAFNRRDYDAALALLKPLAEQGNPAAQYQLGYMYLYGHGVEKNHAEAWFWLTIAASANTTDPKGAATAAAGRNQILKQLTPGQIEAVKKRVEEWKPIEPPAPAEPATP